MLLLLLLLLPVPPAPCRQACAAPSEQPDSWHHSTCKAGHPYSRTRFCVQQQYVADGWRVDRRSTALSQVGQGWGLLHHCQCGTVHNWVLAEQLIRASPEPQGNNHAKVLHEATPAIANTISALAQDKAHLRLTCSLCFSLLMGASACTHTKHNQPIYATASQSKPTDQLNTHLATLQPPHTQALPPTSCSSLAPSMHVQPGLLHIHGTGTLAQIPSPTSCSSSASPVNP